MKSSKILLFLVTVAMIGLVSVIRATKDDRKDKIEAYASGAEAMIRNCGLPTEDFNKRHPNNLRAQAGILTVAEKLEILTRKNAVGKNFAEIADEQYRNTRCDLCGSMTQDIKQEIKLLSALCESGKGERISNTITKEEFEAALGINQ